jgi:predicted metal-binding protein
MTITELARQLGIGTCLEFDSGILIPEERIRSFCMENRCKSYGNNYTCPPYTGSLEEIKNGLGGFQRGWLLQYSKEIDVRCNKEGVVQTKIDFHEKILRLEEFLRERGTGPVWGMIGGNCGLCDKCKAESHEPCAYPDKARTSLEAIAVDVIGLLNKFGLDSEFHLDKITWTGCILF